MKRISTIVRLAILTQAVSSALGAAVASWPDQPLSLGTALNIAIQQNPAITSARQELEAAHGVAVQTRAIVIPKLAGSGNYQIKDEDAVDKLEVPFIGATLKAGNDQSWASNVRLVQSIYEGGRMTSALRSAKLLQQQALLEYQTIVADALTEVRVAFYDILLADRQIQVQDASVRLLEAEFKDAERRRQAGTVPQFEVIRAEVQWASAKPGLIRAKNTFRNAKIKLTNLLGMSVPEAQSEEISLQLSGGLESELSSLPRLTNDLSQAIALAKERRTELKARQHAELLRREGIVQARSGYKPSLQAFAGYEARSPMFSDRISEPVDGWNAGVMMSWNFFDGRLTQGKVIEAKARHERARIELDDAARRTELEVRTAFANVVDAQEVLESQKKVNEQAAEALRLATARHQAGSGTQLDVLAAETSLTEARTTQVQAARDYLAARARLERAVGLEFMPSGNPSGVER